MTSEFREMWSVKVEGTTQHERVMIHETGTVTTTTFTITTAATVSSITITTIAASCTTTVHHYYCKMQKMCGQNGSGKDKETLLKG